MIKECPHDRKCYQGNFDCEHMGNCAAGEGPVKETYERYSNPPINDEGKREVLRWFKGCSGTSVEAEEEVGHWWSEDSGWPPDQRLTEFFGVQPRNGNYASLKIETIDEYRGR